MRMFNLHGTEKEKEDEESSEEESDEGDEEEKKPQMELAMMPHYGGINRVRVRCVPFSRQALLIDVSEGPDRHVFLVEFQTTQHGDQSLAAVWSEKGQVEIFDLRSQIEAIHSAAAMATFASKQKEATSLFSFSGHMTEGFAIDWSPTVPGRWGLYPETCKA